MSKERLLNYIIRPKRESQVSKTLSVSYETYKRCKKANKSPLISLMVSGKALQCTCFTVNGSMLKSTYKENKGEIKEKYIYM